MEILILVVFLLLFLLLISSICVIIYFIDYKDSKSNKDHISFKESLDLTDLPIITFYQGSKKFNFLLDTGATSSVINRECLESLASYKELNSTSWIMGFDGNRHKTLVVEVPLYYKNSKFTSNCQVFDMTNAFKTIKEESGVNLHGILGNDFFIKYKYIIDFKDFVAYIKN